VTGRAEGEMDDRPERSSGLFRRTLVRVIAAQVVALVLLWLVQSRYAA